MRGSGRSAARDAKVDVSEAFDEDELEQIILAQVLCTERYIAARKPAPAGTRNPVSLPQIAPASRSALRRSIIRFKGDQKAIDSRLLPEYFVSLPANIAFNSSSGLFRRLL